MHSPHNHQQCMSASIATMQTCQLCRSGIRLDVAKATETTGCQQIAMAAMGEPITHCALMCIDVPHTTLNLAPHSFDDASHTLCNAPHSRVPPAGVVSKSGHGMPTNWVPGHDRPGWLRSMQSSTVTTAQVAPQQREGSTTAVLQQYYSSTTAA
jgi:hypothetical protein